MRRFAKPLIFALCVTLFLVLVVGLALNDVCGTQAPSEWVSANPTVTTALLRVNLNTATEAELLMLPEMTRSLANGILAYRESFVRINYVEELLSVYGVSEERLDLWKPYITV